MNACRRMKAPKPTTEELKESAEIARALRANPRDREAVSSAETRIASGRGKTLFEALFDAYRTEPDRHEESTIRSMNTALEAMWGESQAVAGYLMARLQPIASRWCHHTEFDGIGLILASADDVRLASFLDQLAKEGVRPRTQIRCLELAASIRRRR
jgi:hypothetical protein